MAAESDELLSEWCSELEAVLYSPEVEEAIREVCPSTNPLDQKDFNPIDYINQLFPNEQSLAGIDERVTQMRVHIRQLDEEIRGVVRGQADSGHDGRLALEEAHRAIQELFGRIRNIKEKAERSEIMVKKITSDIKLMDNAKKHLTDSIRTLERLRFLISNLEQLQVSCRQRNYADVCTELHGAITVVEEFSKYQSIPHIKQLVDRLASLQFDLAQQIKVDFEKAFSVRGAPKGVRSSLHDACQVLDILGGRMKDDLIQWFVRLQLSDYEVMFHESLEGAWLDKVDRRYAWLRRTLVTYEEEIASIFSAQWGIPERVCMDFCSTTRASLRALMASRAADLDVKLLLFAIQKTTSFEKLLSQRFLSSTYLDSLSPPSAEEDSALAAKKDSPFLGLISRCFEPQLSIYISSQDKSLSELLEGFVADLKSRGALQSNSSTSVMPSAADLFVFYKKCLVQCSSLSTGPPLLDLTQLFQKYLRDYCAKVLTPNLPKMPTSSSSSKLSISALRRDTQTESGFTAKEHSTICTVLCTADYCLETTEQLESKLREKIEPALVDKVSFSPEQDAFHSLISSCTQLLVQDLDAACSSAFQAMVKMPWGSVEAVGDQSPYVSAVAAILRSTVPLLREQLASARKYFVNFCHKFANTFIPSFVTHLYKCKPVSMIAAEQLLLDTHSLKTCLLELPSVGAAVARKPPSSYSKLVTKGMERAELVIKVVMSPHEQAEPFIESYTKLMHGDTELSSFQKVLEMKGLKRSEQHVLLELFKSRVETERGGQAELSGGLKHPIRKLEKLMRF